MLPEELSNTSDDHEVLPVQTSVPAELSYASDGRTFRSIIKYIFFSIIIVHLFGLFGVFISLAYPLIWFFFPSKAFCFYCLHQRLVHKDHGYCKVCNREVVTIYNISLKSMLINMITMLFMSVIFFVLIFAEFTLLSKTGINILNPHSEAVIISNASANNYKLNKPFYFDISIDSPNQAINLVKSDITFSNDILEVKEIDTSRSFATIFSLKEFSNKDGSINVIGGLPSPGFVGTNGLFIRIYFNSIKPGVGKVQIQRTSRILANDGKGTDILQEFTSFPLSIEP